MGAFEVLKAYGRHSYVGLMVADFGSASVLFVVFGLFTLHQPGMPLSAPEELMLLGLGLAVGSIWVLILSRFGTYTSQRCNPILSVLGRLLAANSLGALLLLSAAFLLEAPVEPPTLLSYAGLLFAFQGVPRLVAFATLRRLRRSGRNYRNLLILGSGKRALEVESAIESHPEWGLRVVGFVDEFSNDFRPLVPPERLHKMIELPTILREEVIDEVLVAVPRSTLAEITPAVRECALIGVPVTLLTDFYGEDLPHPRVGRLESRSTLTFAPVHHNEAELLLKRTVDVAGALLGLIIAAPVIFVAAFAIKLTSPGPVFFRQIRCGVNGRRFVMLKLRTMCQDAEQLKVELLGLNEMDGPVFKIKNDRRITPVGRLLRRFSIDELPQFWNVLVGDMSLVGPRPPTPEEVSQYEPGVRRRLSMRPGLTCLWQVSGRNTVSFEKWMELDLEYIDTWSLESDLRILWRTLPAVLLARGAS